MIECPRCGFHQPPDKYCANCGVDIEKYNPPQKNALVQVFSNPVVYLLTGVVVIGVLFMVAKNNLPTEVAEEPVALGEVANVARTETPEPAPQPKATISAKPERKKQAAKPTPPPPRPKPVAQPKAAPQPKPAPQFSRSQQQAALANLQDRQEAAPEEPAAAEEPAVANEAPQAAVQQVQLRNLPVSFSEVLNSQIEAAAAQGEVVQEANGFRVVRLKKTISVGGQLLAGRKNLQRLGGREEVVSFDVELGEAAPASNLIFNLQVQVARADAEATELNIEVDTAYLEVNTMGLSVTLASDEKLLIIGGVPRADVPEGTQGLARTPLNIVNSENFQNGQSELVATITAE